MGSDHQKVHHMLTENWTLFSYVCTEVVVRMDYHGRILSWQDTCTEVVTNKAYVLPSRSSTFSLCPAYLNVSKVNATETRMAWTTPHPFKANRQKLPKSREQAMKELCPLYHHIRETLWKWSTLSLPWRGFFLKDMLRQHQHFRKGKSVDSFQSFGSTVLKIQTRFLWSLIRQ